LKGDPQIIDLTGINDLSRIPIRKRMFLGKEIKQGDYVLQLLVRGKRQADWVAQSLNFQVVNQ
jgi:hypothetical protein